MKYAFLLMLIMSFSAYAEDKSVWDGVYTQTQAEAGKAGYERSCISCHADKEGEVAGHGPAPAIIGEEFMYRWTDTSVADLLDVIRQTMPEAAPNSLSGEEYAAITAYVLLLNGFPAGNRVIDPMEREELMMTYIEEAPAL